MQDRSDRAAFPAGVDSTTVVFGDEQASEGECGGGQSAGDKDTSGLLIQRHRALPW